MAKMKLPVTKSTYLDLKERLSFAQEGFDLLEEKRQILVIELMNRVEAVKRMQKRIIEVMQKAYTALQKAQITNGTHLLERTSLAVKVSTEVRIESHVLMGIDIPSIETAVADFDAQFGFGEGSSHVDEVVKLFCQALEVVAKLAELENVVLRVARELKKTQRRVNALEKIFIPDYKETIKYITDALEERERDSFVIMKLLKERLQSRSR